MRRTVQTYKPVNEAIVLSTEYLFVCRDDDLSSLVQPAALASSISFLYVASKINIAHKKFNILLIKVAQNSKKHFESLFEPNWKLTVIDFNKESIQQEIRT